LSFHVPNRYRIRTGPFGSDDAYGNNGAFFVPNPHGARTEPSPLRVIASDGLAVPEEHQALAGWEHVSVSLPNRCPTWPEMAYIKGLFWDAADCVVQFHPPESEYVNNHPYCLHLWRPVGHDIPTPPALLVGLKGVGELA
jgi:hypothetical protein